ncbi:hypothetical protein AcW1_004348 [Taiwanofungus camphoratus]|nr:hypothetical protein AcV7_008066 [Antrodia cinnamomea]KAI0959552.1 hypothetical protein AcW1_004348 [Antrodia cinnamomea]
MFSLANSFRAAARPSTWRSSLSASAAAVTRRANSTASTPQTAGALDEVSGLLNEAGDAPAPLAGPRTPEYNYDEINYVSKSVTGIRGFYPDNFIQPLSLSRKARISQQRHRRAYPLLGPDAKDARAQDVFHQLEIDPLDECDNSALMSHFVSQMGKINKRASTKLTWRSQRRLGKAIRRAKMMGIIPVLSKRPLSLLND